MITTIVFDIGGVFFHEPRELQHTLWRTLGLVDASVGDNLMHGGDLWDVYKRGGMNEEEYWTRLIQELPVQYNGTWDTLCAEFEHAIILDEELVTLARQLKEHYHVHVLSNAGAELERRLRHFEIIDLFGEVINSHNVKMAKPDEAIYRYTSEIVGAEPDEILFVDDKLRNTSVAESIGFHTHVYSHARSFREFISECGLYVE